MVVPLILAAPLWVLPAKQAQAADFTDRRLDLGSSVASDTTTHTLSFIWTTPASVGSMRVEYCANTPLFVLTCNAPAGMNLTSPNVVLSSESGETGFSILSRTANTITLTRPAAVVTETVTPSSYLFTNVRNPNATGSYYVRFSSYASLDGTGPRIDQGGLSFTMNDPLNIGAFVPPFLLFCLGRTIPTNSCASASGSEIDFGDFSTTNTSRGTTQMLAATNGDGYNVSIAGTTMTSGNNIIPRLTTPTASIPGTSQFGLNLRDNSTPNVGANVTGVGSGTPTADYNTVNRYMFENGDIIASASVSTNINKYTHSYIVNISEDQNPGVYATTLTYIAFANF